MTPHELLAVFAVIGDLIIPGILGVAVIAVIWIARNEHQLKTMRRSRK